MLRFSRRIRIGRFAKQVIAFAFFFGVVLGAVAAAEYTISTKQSYQVEAQDLHDTVEDLSASLFPNGRLDLTYYRQSANQENSSYLVISTTGELVDIYSAEGDAADLIHGAIPVSKYLSAQPAHMTTDFGESWIVEARPIVGGYVIGGISATDLIGLSDPELLIARELRKYGGTLAHAKGVSGSVIRNYMTGVMLVSDSGAISSSTGSAVPLRVELLVPDDFLDGKVHDFSFEGHSYSLLSRRASSMLIVAFDQMDTSVAATNLRDNLFVAGGAWLIAVLGYLGLTARERLQQARTNVSSEISTRQLIDQGENAPVEFKSTLRKNLHTGENDQRIEQAVLKTIAAFLNTDGGTLLIGVDDKRMILGLGPDGFESVDRGLLHLTNLVRSRIGTQFPAYMRMRVDVMDNDLQILRVDCRRSSTPAYVKGDGREQHFYVRTGPSTEELTVGEAHEYIKRRFEGSL